MIETSKYRMPRVEPWHAGPIRFFSLMTLRCPRRRSPTTCRGHARSPVGRSVLRGAPFHSAAPDGPLSPAPHRCRAVPRCAGRPGRTAREVPPQHRRTSQSPTYGRRTRPGTHTPTPPTHPARPRPRACEVRRGWLTPDTQPPPRVRPPGSSCCLLRRPRRQTTAKPRAPRRPSPDVPPPTDSDGSFRTRLVDTKAAYGDAYQAYPWAMVPSGFFVCVGVGRGARGG